MKITKIPDSIDPNKLIVKRVDEKLRKCPFCGENRDYWDDLHGVMISHHSWYGREHENTESIFLWPFGKKRLWQISEFKCYTCGAEWKSDPYPVDIEVGEINIDEDGETIEVMGESIKLKH